MSSIKSNQPLVVVTHQRDWPMLELLARSLKNIHIDHPLYVIANDFKNIPSSYYRDKLRPLLVGRELVVMSNADFSYVRSSLPEAGRIRYQQEGWINQQILKLAIAEIFPKSVREYLVLDSQNFLVNPFEWPDTEKTPIRVGPWSMHQEIWNKICDEYDKEISVPAVSLSTPIFLNRQIVLDMMEDKGSVYSWSEWFVSNGHLASEFACYSYWVEKNNKWTTDHEAVDDWAIAYLRDSQTFENNFKEFISWFFDEVVNKRAWASINHRAWTQMDSAQYTFIKSLLEGYGLEFDMSSLRLKSKELVFE